MLPPGFIALALLTSAVTSGPIVYHARCNGVSALPHVSTNATGSLSVTLIDHSYATATFYAHQLTMAHLHAGATGKNGPVIAWAFNATCRPLSGSIKATFTFDPSVNNISSLLAAGLVYFNVHTMAYPAGELRGQLIRSGTTSPSSPTPHQAPDPYASMPSELSATGSNPPPLPHDLPRSLTSKQPAPSSVVIIGAGLSGLTAARTLLTSGKTFSSVTVLEGNNRAGGRIDTIPTNAGFPIEMGATWCHCCSSKNPLSLLATALGVPLKNDVGSDNAYQFDSTGKILNPTGNDYSPMVSIYNSFYSWMENQIGSKDTRSVGDMFNAYVKAKSLTTTNQQLLLKGINDKIEQEYAASMGNLSAKYYDEDLDFCSKGNTPDALFPTGVSSIIQKLISASSINVVYNAKVVSIDYSGSIGLVRVMTSTGAQYMSRWVISTIPLGVMQSNTIVFTPPLPSAMTSALYQLNMGALERIVLVFDSAWWDPKGNLQPGWLNPPIGPPGGLWNEWYSLSGTLGRPVLIGWNAGNTAVSALARNNDASILASSLDVLSAMFPRLSIPQPTEYYVSHWQTNPWSLGSYSSIRPNVTATSLNDKLAVPVGSSSSGQVLFAGEHTTSQYPSTMHGAILTGQREANRIIAAMSG